MGKLKIRRIRRGQRGGDFKKEKMKKITKGQKREGNYQIFLKSVDNL